MSIYEASLIKSVITCAIRGDLRDEAAHDDLSLEMRQRTDGIQISFLEQL